MNSVLALQLAEINGKFKVLNGQDSKGGLLTEYEITEENEIVEFFIDLIRSGKYIQAVLRMNEQFPEGNIWEWDDDIRVAWNAFQKSHSQEYGSFLSSGTGLKILFKRTESGRFYFNEIIINLP